MLTYSSPDDVGDASTDSRQQQKKWKIEKPLGNRHADREVDEVCDPKHESNCEQMLPSGSTNKEAGKDSGKKHTDRRIKPRLVIMKAPGDVPMAPAFVRD